jgi:CRP-like cAMP-binding protein
MLLESDIKRLKGNVFFGSLPDQVLQHVLSQSRVKSVNAGEMIFQQGEDASIVYCIVEGAIKLTVMTKGGEVVVVELFHAGDSFGEALAFRDLPYPVSASALVNSRVVAVPKSVIRLELRAHPDAYPAVVSAAYTHLHRLVQQIEQLKATSATQRTAGFLLALADGNENGSEFHMPYEKQTVASMLGIKPETLSRSFRKLEEHGLSVRGDTIHILDRNALEKFLNED